MFGKLGKRMLGVVAVVCVIIFLAPAALAAGPDGTSPANAMAPLGEWKALGVGGEDWYVFRTPGTVSDPSQVTIEVQVAPVNGAVFTVWDTERLNKKANADRNELIQPVGAGSAQPLDDLGFLQKLSWTGSVATKEPFYVSVKQVGSKAGGYFIKISGDKLTFPAMGGVVAKAVEAPKPAAAPKAGSGPSDAFTPTGEWKTLGPNEGHWYVVNTPGADSKGKSPQITAELLANPPGSASFCVWTPEGLRVWMSGAVDESTLPVGRASAQTVGKGETAQKSVWSGQFNMGGSYYICVRQAGSQPSVYKLDVTVK